MYAANFQQLAIAVGLGLLVGFQREWTSAHVAGIRSFTFITLLGTILSLMSDSPSDALVVVGLAAVAAVMVVGRIVKLHVDDERGLTTQFAAFVMYGVGVALGQQHTEMGVMVGGAVAVLLQLKKPLHRFVDSLGEREMRAIIQFSLLGLVILPIMPNQTYGPYGVLNPFEIWLMVVLICGFSLGSYIAYRYLGPQADTLLGGVLGGLISSTATTVTYARGSKNNPENAPLAAMVIMIASTIVFGRVLFEIAVVAPSLLPVILPPLIAMTALMAVIAGVQYLCRGEAGNAIEHTADPAELKVAIAFGVMYAGVILAVAIAKEHFGDGGLFVVAALSGMTDMDAITLSTTQMIKAGKLPAETGWRMILVGALSNLVFKAAAVGVLGNGRLFRRVVLLFSVGMVCGVLILVYWPDA